MPVLNLQNISKQFPGVKALDDVNLDLNQGEIHALVGENGAGKSTLMNILSGIIKPDRGELYIDGEKIPYEKYDPHVSIAKGIAHVHQELSLCPNMSIAENIFFNRAPEHNGVINHKQLYANTRKLLHLFDIHIDPKTNVNRLSFGVRQQIEILKAISQNAKIIIFDEPTTGISENEVKKLFVIIRKLKDSGIGIFYISHKLDEVLDLVDRITVLRDGKIIKTMPKAEATKETVISLMVGRRLMDLYPEKKKQPSESDLFVIEGLNKKDLLHNINLKLKKGEILGLYGLVGAGRSELCDAVFGVIKKDRGTFYIEGKKVSINNSRDAICNGIGYLPEDRKLQGLFLQMSIRQNIISSKLENYCKGFIMSAKKEKQAAVLYSGKFGVVTNSVEKTVKQLSGGNQQKVMLAKWLSIHPKILLVDEPTKGIDIGAKAEIHRILRQLADDGVSVIMVSSELPEILGVSDRLLVMHNGEIKGEMKIKEASQESIMNLIQSSN